MEIVDRRLSEKRQGRQLIRTPLFEALKAVSGVGLVQVDSW